MNNRLCKSLCLLFAIAICISGICGCHSKSQPVGGASSATGTTSAITTLPSAGTTAATTLGDYTVPTAPQTPTEKFPVLSARTAFVYDTRSDEFLYRNCDEYTSVYPASTTKLFTTYVALRYLDLEEYVTVGSELNLVAFDASKAGFQYGDTVRVEDLAYAALLPSGCDASYILAAAAGRVILKDENASAGAAISIFMSRVNGVAALFHMDGSFFVTPDGIHHRDHKISVMSFVTIAKLCMEHECISRIVGTRSKEIEFTDRNGNTKAITLVSTNQCLNPNSTFYRTNTYGLKTGYTTPAGYCFLGTCTVKDGYLIIGTLGCANANDRFKNFVALSDYFSAIDDKVSSNI